MLAERQQPAMFSQTASAIFRGSASIAIGAALGGSSVEEPPQAGTKAPSSKPRLAAPHQHPLSSRATLFITANGSACSLTIDGDLRAGAICGAWPPKSAPISAEHAAIGR